MTSTLNFVVGLWSEREYKKNKRLFAMNPWISISGPADIELDLDPLSL